MKQQYRYKEWAKLIKLTYQQKLDWTNQLILYALKENKNPSVSLSWGKDSVVMLHLIRQFCKNTKVIFANTGIEYPETYKRTKKFMMVTQYVQGKMAGTTIEDAFWENTSAPLSGLADTVNDRWSVEICRSLEIDIDKLPRIVFPTEIIGTLTAAAASDCDLLTGVPIIAGAYDKPCDQLGSGAGEVGDIVDNAATYPALTACVDSFKADTDFKTLECSPAATKGLWITMTYIIGGGLTHKWFCDEFCSIHEEESTEGISIYKELDKKASKLPPGSEGIVFIPHLGGRATPSDPDVRGAWAGFTWTHKKEHFYRALLEAIAYDHASSLAVIKKSFPHISFNHVKVIGGGARSRLWNEIKTNVLGLPYCTINREDTTTLGAAIIGGKAVGLFADENETAKSICRIEESFNTRADLHDSYKPFTDMYNDIFNNLRGLYEQLSQIRSIDL